MAAAAAAAAPRCLREMKRSGEGSGLGAIIGSDGLDWLDLAKQFISILVESEPLWTPNSRQPYLCSAC